MHLQNIQTLKKQILRIKGVQNKRTNNKKNTNLQNTVKYFIICNNDEEEN